MIRVAVTAEDGTEQHYVITVRRAGPSAPAPAAPSVSRSNVVQPPQHPPSIAIIDATGIEGGDIAFTINKSGNGAVTVEWRASVGSSDTAQPEDLGAATSGKVSFDVSETSKTFAVATVQDNIDEDNETFTVTPDDGV